jgi:hypothetical protein
VAWGGIEPPTQGFSSFAFFIENQRHIKNLFYKNCVNETVKAFASAGLFHFVEWNFML